MINNKIKITALLWVLTAAKVSAQTIISSPIFDPQIKTSTYLLNDRTADIIKAAIENGIISNTDGKYKLSTTIYGLKLLFDSTLNTDINYGNNKFNRNFHINATVSTDEGNNISEASPSFKIALINKRDLKDFENVSSRAQSLINNRDALFESLIRGNGSIIGKILEKKLNDSTISQEQRKAFKESIDKNLSFQASEKISAESFNSGFKSIESFLTPAEKATVQSTVNLINNQINNIILTHDSAVRQIKRGSLLTFEAGATYFLDPGWSDIFAKFDYVHGLGWSSDEDKPWDINMYAQYKAQNDTTVEGVNTERQTGSFYAGLNKAILTKRVAGQQGVARQSVLELLGSAGFDYTFDGLYEGEDNFVFNLDFVLSVRLAENLYLPLEIKYDPANSNVFGFLKLSWNLPAASN